MDDGRSMRAVKNNPAASSFWNNSRRWCYADPPDRKLELRILCGAIYYS